MNNNPPCHEYHKNNISDLCSTFFTCSKSSCNHRQGLRSSAIMTNKHLDTRTLSIKQRPQNIPSLLFATGVWVPWW